MGFIKFTCQIQDHNILRRLNSSWNHLDRRTLICNFNKKYTLFNTVKLPVFAPTYNVISRFRHRGQGFPFCNLLLLKVSEGGKYKYFPNSKTFFNATDDLSLLHRRRQVQKERYSCYLDHRRHICTKSFGKSNILGYNQII